MTSSFINHLGLSTNPKSFDEVVSILFVFVLSKFYVQYNPMDETEVHKIKVP